MRSKWHGWAQGTMSRVHGFSLSTKSWILLILIRSTNTFLSFLQRLISTVLAQHHSLSTVTKSLELQNTGGEKNKKKDKGENKVCALLKKKKRKCKKRNSSRSLPHRNLPYRIVPTAVIFVASIDFCTGVEKNKSGTEIILICAPYVLTIRPRC